jgi:hypothetical protein
MLGTLLHEICHIFFFQNACRHSHNNVWDFGEDGHGRAWQVLAAAVERKFTDFTGLSTMMGRFDAIHVHWDKRRIVAISACT